MNTNRNTFNESTDSTMDRILPKKSFFQKYKYYVIVVVLSIFFFVYVFATLLQGKKIRIDKDKIQIAKIEELPFLDYVDTEGIVLPISTIRINTLEQGFVSRIVSEEGAFIKKGDTILILENPELNRIIEEQLSEWEKQRILYREKQMEMQQKTILLKQQALQARYELNRLHKDFTLGEEEFKMGIKSKAQLEVQKEEFTYKTQSTLLQLENLKHDSISTKLRYELMNNDLQRAHKQTKHIQKRLDNLIVRAPIDGQLSFLNVTLGQQISMSENVGEIKVIDNFKIRTRLSEHYIDRISVGLPAAITYQNEKFPLRVAKVVPEVKERQFEVDLVFIGKKPDNVRIGKNFRLQIELGQPETTIVMPRGDFFQTTAGQWIFKLNESETKAVKVPIHIGRQNPAQYEVIDGLKAGDKVIIGGYNHLTEVETIEIR